MKAHVPSPTAHVPSPTAPFGLPGLRQALKALDNARLGLESASQQDAELEKERDQVMCENRKIHISRYSTVKV